MLHESGLLLMAYKEMQQNPNSSSFEDERMYEVSFSCDASSGSPPAPPTHFYGRYGVQIYGGQQCDLCPNLNREEAAPHRFGNSTMKHFACDAAVTNFRQHSSGPQIGSNSSCRADSHEEPRKEHMFDKPLTPSDVGKLNRLVIPKQHAERYFPTDPTVTEKGLLLSFEGSNGSQWKFRYSYWNSSQSYVLTKGWSRFVKENRLDAGDIVSFQRRATDGGANWQLFIGCRRRASVQAEAQMHQPTIGVLQWDTRHYCPPPVVLISDQHRRSDYREQLDTGIKRLRLFGVNLDCPARTAEPS